MALGNLIFALSRLLSQQCFSSSEYYRAVTVQVWKKRNGKGRGTEVGRQTSLSYYVRTASRALFTAMAVCMFIHHVIYLSSFLSPFYPISTSIGIYYLTSCTPATPNCNETIMFFRSSIDNTDQAGKKPENLDHHRELDSNKLIFWVSHLQVHRCSTNAYSSSALFQKLIM